MYWRKFSDWKLLDEYQDLKRKFSERKVTGIVTSKHKDFAGYLFFCLEECREGLVSKIEILYNNDYGETVYPQGEQNF
jgi:hypothetical protein